MADSLRYQDWYDKAQRDLRGAKILLSMMVATIWLRSIASKPLRSI